MILGSDCVSVYELLPHVDVSCICDEYACTHIYIGVSVHLKISMCMSVCVRTVCLGIYMYL